MGLSVDEASLYSNAVIRSPMSDRYSLSLRKTGIRCAYVSVFSLIGVLVSQI